MSQNSIHSNNVYYSHDVNISNHFSYSIAWWRIYEHGNRITVANKMCFILAMFILVYWFRWSKKASDENLEGSMCKQSVLWGFCNRLLQKARINCRLRNTDTCIIDELRKFLKTSNAKWHPTINGKTEMISDKLEQPKWYPTT